MASYTIVLTFLSQLSPSLMAQLVLDMTLPDKRIVNRLSTDMLSPLLWNTFISFSLYCNAIHDSHLYATYYFLQILDAKAL